MTPIYRRVFCNDPVTTPLQTRYISAIVDIKCNGPVTTPLQNRYISALVAIKCNDPCNDPVTFLSGDLQSKLTIRNECNDVTAKKNHNGRCRKIGLKGQNIHICHDLCKTDVTPVTPVTPPLMQKTRSHIWGYRRPMN